MTLSNLIPVLLLAFSPTAICAQGFLFYDNCEQKAPLNGFPGWDSYQGPELGHCGETGPRGEKHWQVSSKHARKGRYSYRFEVEKCPDYKGRDPQWRHKKSELAWNYPGQARGLRWIAFSILIPSTDDPQGEGLAWKNQELCADYASYGPPNGKIDPDTWGGVGGGMFQIKRGTDGGYHWAAYICRYMSRQDPEYKQVGEYFYADTEQGGTNKFIREFVDLGPIQTGAWTDWVIERNFSSGKDGFIRYYRNGNPQPVLTVGGPNWPPPGANPPHKYRPEAYWQFGVYDDVYEGAKYCGVVPSYRSRVLYLDEIKFGTKSQSLEDFVLK